MSIRERKEREKEEMHNLILDAASKIICDGGIEKLSIRKIASMIDYSPTIIYHYFKDKDEIVTSIVSKKYLEMIKEVLESNKEDLDSTEQLKNMVYRYIKCALDNKDIYKTVMLSSNDKVLENTSILFKGVTSERKLMNIFKKIVDKVLTDNKIQNNEIENTIQFIWISIFGLIIRLTVEKNISDDEREILIRNHIQIVINNVLLNK